MGQLYKDLQYWRGYRSLRPSLEILYTLHLITVPTHTAEMNEMKYVCHLPVKSLATKPITVINQSFTVVNKLSL